MHYLFFVDIVSRLFCFLERRIVYITLHYIVLYFSIFVELAC